MPATIHAYYQSPVGELTLIAGAEGSGLRALLWPGQKHRAHFPHAGLYSPVCLHRVLRQTARELDEYFAGTRTHFDVALGFEGDTFSKQVWELLREIQFGETTSYGTLAERLGNRHLAQRVGQSVGGNPIGLIVPCHRVLGSDGSLTGFSGGIEVKRWLLSHEEPVAASVGRLF